MSVVVNINSIVEWNIGLRPHSCFDDRRFGSGLSGLG